MEVSPHWKEWAAAYSRMETPEREEALRSLAPDQRAHFERVWEILEPQLETPPDASAGSEDPVADSEDPVADKVPRSERRSRRLALDFEVVFNKSGDSVSYRGHADDISAGGIRLKAEGDGVQPVGTRLEIKVSFQGSGFVVEGEVVHSSGSEMGVRFIPLNELVAPLLVSPGAPADRSEASQNLAAELGIYKLSYESPEDYQAVHDGILKIGGMLVSTPHPSPLGKEIRVEITLAFAPEAEPASLAARVVGSFQREAGVMGVEITNLQSASRDLRRLRAVSDRIAASTGPDESSSPGS